MSKPFRLHFEKQGQGFPLVLLHGNGESASYFDHQMACFSRHATVFALDTRGHGLSPRGDGPFTLHQFAEDLNAFLDEQGLRQVDLLGFSDGGNIALLFALKYPQRVRKLVLSGANLRPLGVRPVFQALICLGYGLVCLAALFDPKAHVKKEMLSLMVREPHISMEQLSALPMPVLVMAGTHDLIRTAHTKGIAKALPQGQLCLLKGDHFIAQKVPEAFNQAVCTFLWGA